METDVDPKKSLSMFLAVADTEEHLIYSQYQEDKRDGWSVKNNPKVSLDTDHVCKEASER